jgi:hypothetical protein
VIASGPDGLVVAVPGSLDADAGRYQQVVVPARRVLGSGAGVGQQARPEGIVDPGTGDDPGAVGRRGGGEDPVEDGVELFAADNPALLEEDLQPPHAGGDTRVGMPVAAAHGASSSGAVEVGLPQVDDHAVVALAPEASKRTA